MPEDISDLKERLVAGWARGGRRRRFDAQAKRELVQACLQPNVSVARMAVEYGLHANLLRKWMRNHEQAQSGGVAKSRAIENATPAFVPVVRIDAAETLARQGCPRPASTEAARLSQRPPSLSRLVAQLPNGVTLKLECDGPDATLMSTMIETLVRCDVPARC
jgi:transposase